MCVEICIKNHVVFNVIQASVRHNKTNVGIIILRNDNDVNWSDGHDWLNELAGAVSWPATHHARPDRNRNHVLSQDNTRLRPRPGRT